MIQVGIDFTPIIYRRGVSRYTQNLITALLERHDVQVSLFGSSWRQRSTLQHAARELSHRFPTRLPADRVVIQSYPPRLQEFLWSTVHLNPIRQALPNIQVFHSWDWLQPPDTTLPLVSTVHDLALLRFPETAHPQILRGLRRSWAVLKERNAHVIAVSRTTRDDLITLLDWPKDHVHLVYEALPQETRSVMDAMTEEQYEAMRDKLQLQRPYVLFVGTREPRKNLLQLIEAWEPLRKEVDLIVAGEVGWDHTTSLAKEAKKKGLRFLGRVSDAELAVLYGEATVFAYPSLYEGFGLPILEAFSHGTPVVTSNVSAMPEVAGNAAELVDPLSSKSIRQGISTILNESHDAQQKRLQRMIIRLQLFSWATVAEETVKVYQRALDDQS